MTMQRRAFDWECELIDITGLSVPLNDNFSPHLHPWTNISEHFSRAGIANRLMIMPEKSISWGFRFDHWGCQHPHLSTRVPILVDHCEAGGLQSI